MLPKYPRHLCYGRRPQGGRVHVMADPNQALCGEQVVRMGRRPKSWEPACQECRRLAGLPPVPTPARRALDRLCRCNPFAMRKERR
jgi:hypothetical protein